MTYKDVIKDRPVMFEGDFFKQYKINNKQFIIYKDNRIKCIELCRFLEISAELLMTYIDEDDVEETSNEFHFEVEITKEELFKYLFDVESVSSGRYVPHISSRAGYILSESVFKNEINEINDDSDLIYDNKLVFCSNEKNKEKQVHIATDVATYNLLNIDCSIQGSVYLVPTDSIYFINKIDCVGYDIYIYAKDNMLYSLSIYIKLYNLLYENSFILEYDDSQIIFSFMISYIGAEDLMQLLSNAESTFTEKGIYGNRPKLHYNVILGDIDEGKIHTVYFPRTKKHLRAFLLSVLDEHKNTNDGNVHLIL